MKYPILLFIILSVFGCTSNSDNSETKLSNDPFTAFADSLFNTHVDSSDIAGSAVLVARGDEILLDQSYGYASLELEAEMPLHASFEIGSVTKQFTAAAIIKLVEEGKLSLDDDMTKYLDFDTQGRKVTIGHLLNHTSGIASYTEIPEFWPLSLHNYDRDTLLRVVENAGYLFEPGEAMIYNNSGYFFLGLIIEKVSGESYEEYLEEKIFSPLGMNNTYYCSTSKIVKNKAYGYGYSPDGLRQKDYLDHTWPYAAGSLCSTTEDLYIWMKALHNGKMFDEASYNMMVSPGTLNDGSPIRYAMGISNYKDYGYQKISHGGGINGFLSESRYYPDEDLYVIALVNTIGPQGAGFFASELTWELLEQKETPGIEMESDLSGLSGNFEGQVRGRRYAVEVTVTNDGLVMLAQGDEEADTVKTYIGNNTWTEDNDLFTLNENEIRIDQVGGYYILARQE